MLSKLEFDILCYIDEKRSFSVELIANALFKDFDVVNFAINELESKKLIVDGVLTDGAYRILQSHKIDNAIILAAGMSTRFVPLNFDIPKGLLEVKGEKLVERQIRQLKEKGIDEIYVVVGYMKEQFEYLIDKFNVKLVVTEDFAESFRLIQLHGENYFKSRFPNRYEYFKNNFSQIFEE